MSEQKEDYERPRLEPYHDHYRLSDDWHTDCKGVLPAKITVPSGYITDGASIPRFLWTICGSPMDVPRIYAAIVHDWLYEAPHLVPVSRENAEIVAPCTRADADRIYRDYQIALGVSCVKAYTEYCALRLFGGGHWEN